MHRIRRDEDAGSFGYKTIRDTQYKTYAVFLTLQ